MALRHFLHTTEFCERLDQPFPAPGSTGQLAFCQTMVWHLVHCWESLLMTRQVSSQSFLWPGPEGQDPCQPVP